MADNDTRNASKESGGSSQRTLLGAGLIAAAAGAATFVLARRNADMRDDGEDVSDAPDHVWRTGDRADHALVGRTVTINRPRDELYAEWRDFTRFPRFMENVEQVEKLDGKRSRWTIKAPLGSTVELVTRITADERGKAIAWESEPESEIETEGRVDFLDAPPGRGTVVRLTMRYTPPGGIIGKGLAKLFQREPDLQARRDLRRFKQLMETGEIPTNASPSGRSSESPTETKI